MQLHPVGRRVPLALPPSQKLRSAELEQAELEGLVALHGQVDGHVPADLEHVLQIPQVPEPLHDRHGAVFEEHLPVAGVHVARVHLAAFVLVRLEGGGAVEEDASGDDDAVGFDDGFEVAEEGAGREGGPRCRVAGEVGEPEVGGLDEVFGFGLWSRGSHVGGVESGQRSGRSILVKFVGLDIAHTPGIMLYMFKRERFEAVRYTMETKAPIRAILKGCFRLDSLWDKKALLMAIYIVHSLHADLGQASPLSERETDCRTFCEPTQRSRSRW